GGGNGFERPTETYGEWRYAQGQLRARLDRLDPQSPAPPGAAPGEPQGKAGSVNFVPLSSFKVCPAADTTSRPVPPTDEIPIVTNEYDVIVVGAGTGGYVAAIRAAQLGLTV